MFNSVWSGVSSKTSVFKLILCLDGLAIDVNGVQPPTIVLLSISPIMFINTFFMYLDSPMLNALHLHSLCVLFRLTLYHCIVLFFIFLLSFSSICMKNLCPFHFQPVCFCRSEVSLLQAVMCILFFIHSATSCLFYWSFQSIYI